MADESKSTQEDAGITGGTVTAEPSAPVTGEEAVHDHEHGHDHDHHHHGEPAGPKPIRIESDLVAKNSREEIEKQTGHPVKNVPYQLISEEKRPGSIFSLKIEVAASDFTSELNRHYEELRKELILPGFRKGKAPLKLVRIRVGSEEDVQAMNETVVNVVRQEIEKRSLDLISDPSLVSWNSKEGEPLTFEVHIEIEPTLDLKEYKGLSVTIETNEIEEKDVDARIDAILAENATWEPAPEGRVVTEGDGLVIDLVVTGEKGQEIKNLSRKDWLVRDYRTMLPEELAGKLPGETRGSVVSAQVKTSFETRRGEIVEAADTYTATIQDIRILVKPELTDAFAAESGEFKTVQEYRDSIRAGLKTSEDKRQEEASVGRILAAMLEKNPFDIPATYVARSARNAIARDSQMLKQFGRSLDDVVENADEYLMMKHLSAEMSVKAEHLFRALAERESLAATQEEVDAEIAQIAEKSGRKPLAVLAKLEADKRLEALRDDLTTRKVKSYLLANNTVGKVAASKEPAASAAPEAPESPSEGKA